MPASNRWANEQLSAFCTASEFGLGFVPAGALLMPPSRNYNNLEAGKASMEDPPTPTPFDELPSEGQQEEHEAQLREVRDKLERMFQSPDAE